MNDQDNVLLRLLMLRTIWLDVSYHDGTEYLVIVDRFSHYPWVRESPTCDTEAIIKILSYMAGGAALPHFDMMAHRVSSVKTTRNGHFQ